MTSAAEITILGISGSLREASFNRRLVRLAGDLSAANVTVVELDGLGDVEPFNADHEHEEHPGVQAWRHAIRLADAVLISTPEYNGSIPGQLKNALDWASRSDSETPGMAGSALYGKPVAVTSASKGQFGGTWAAEALRTILTRQGARVIGEPLVAVGNGEDAFAPDGTLVNSGAQQRLTELIAALASSVEQLRAAGVA